MDGTPPEPVRAAGAAVAPVPAPCEPVAEPPEPVGEADADDAPEFTGLELPRPRTVDPGAPPGLDAADLTQLSSTGDPVEITVHDYSPDRVQVTRVDDIEDFILHHRPEWCHIRWINVDNLGNMDVIRALADKYELHPLAVEDLLHLPQRPKVDPYPEGDGRRARLFIIVRMLELKENHLQDEQISIFLGHKTVLTFQENPGDVWGPIRKRLMRKGSRLRTEDASFLVYAMLDAIVDHCFPILEFYGDRLEELEDKVFENPNEEVLHDIHALKRELLLLRRAVWPMREVVQNLQREVHECFSDVTRTYLRDVYDHAVQIIDMVETYREVANGLTENYMNAVSLRMNQVVKVLTVISTIFIPLTFLAGVYGMNFEGMPETNASWNYPWLYPIGFWGACLTIAGGLLAWFRKRGWL